MPDLSPADFQRLYAGFQAPITALDCGAKCAPHNEYSVPFCCDTRHAVPSAYLPEWQYLKASTDLWHPWEIDDIAQMEHLREETPQEQVLIECLGHRHCQRDYRSITCRAFPFFPFVDETKEFIGLSYYDLYENRCWVISNLEVVTQEYRTQFIAAFDVIFQVYPDELNNFAYHAAQMRRDFASKQRSVPVLHRDGNDYLIDAQNGSLKKIDLKLLLKHEPYKTTAELRFPDENQ